MVIQAFNTLHTGTKGDVAEWETKSQNTKTISFIISETLIILQFTGTGTRVVITFYVFSYF